MTNVGRGTLVLRPLGPHEAKIEHTHAVARAQHHVRRFEVAMDEPGRMRRRQTSGRRNVHVTHRCPRGARALLPLRERFTVDVLHGDEEPTIERADIVNGDDVGMRQLRQRLRLPQRACFLVGVRRAAEQSEAADLDRELAVELGVVRGEHLPETARADALDEQVAAHGVAASQRAQSHHGATRPHG